MNEIITENFDGAPIDMGELIRLGAVDSSFFGKTFFERTFRQSTPKFHREMDVLMEHTPKRLVCLKAFRGSGKTTKARVLLAKRIAYGLSKTIIIGAKSEGHAKLSLKWLRKQIMHNHKYADAFQLEPGDTWSDIMAEIKHGVEGHTCTVLALGMTGSVRGINVDDWRPDFIMLDDPLDAENSATDVQRQKIEELILGDLKESLAPASESPSAKMVMLQTPMNAQDISMKADDDIEWESASFPIWTRETLDLPVDMQESVWEERFPSEVVRAEKHAAIRRNQVSIFTREKEVRIVAREASAFRRAWLQFYDLAPENMFIAYAIDPVPPPSPNELAKGLTKKDFEAHTIIGKKMDNRFLLDYRQMRGHDPSWTIKTFFELVRKWKPKRVVVESVAYQRVLAWLLRAAMDERKIWVPVFEIVDKRSKYNRILDAYSGVASAGKFWVREEHSDFITQFEEYANVVHDDLLDSGAMALCELNGEFTNDPDEQNLKQILAQEEKEYPRLNYSRGAP